MTATVISVEGLTKRFRLPIDRGSTLQYRLTHPVKTSRYRELLAVNDVSFDIREGEFVGITGPNGCGKSTLLKMVSRIYDPDSGRVTVRGRVSPFLELGAGFKPELTAKENIFLGGALLGPTHGQLAKRVDDVLDFAELTEFGDQKLKNFSSGMTVRLGFAVAMLADANILLLDEVLAVGDARFQEKCFEVFAHYKREGRTIVLVTHDLNALELHCDRVLLMHSGRLIAEGAPTDVTAKYRQIISSMSERIPATRRAGGAGQGRWGSGEMEITGTRIVDRGGRQHHSFLTGDTMTIEIEYVSHTLRGPFTAGVRIFRANGAVLAASISTVAPHALPAVEPGSRGVIAYTIPQLTLLDGSYFVAVGLADEHFERPCDGIARALEFRVTDTHGRPGSVDLGGRWSHTSEEDLVNGLTSLG
jgi:ABC-type polysaccharide/polyol phosphate transport system ATPase subunit